MPLCRVLGTADASLPAGYRCDVRWSDCNDI